MKPDDFERLFTTCQSDEQPAENELSTMQSGICWFKNTNGFPDIETLEDILAMDGKFDPEDELCSDEGFDLAAEEETIKRDTETIRCGIQDSPFIATIPASFIETPDGEYTTALIEIVFKKDPDSNLYRYIMQSEDTNALFYGVVQQEDALRDIFIASHLYCYSSLVDCNNLCGNGSVCRPWNYLILQADFPEELQEKVALTRPIRETSQEAWCYCGHVVDGKCTTLSIRYVTALSLKSYFAAGIPLQKTLQPSIHLPSYSGTAMLMPLQRKLYQPESLRSSQSLTRQLNIHTMYLHK